MSTYRIRYNKSSIHIEGFDTATTGGGQDMGSHVSYAAYSHCPALTRHAARMGFQNRVIELRHEDDPTIAPGRVRRGTEVAEWDDPRAVLEAARLRNRVHGGKVCAKCTEAAMRAIEQS